MLSLLMKRGIVFATLASSAAALLAAAPLHQLPLAGDAVAERWIEASTPNFTFYGAADPEEVAAVAADLERLRAVLAQLSPGGRFDSAVPFRLYLFRDEATLANYRPSDAPATGGGPGLAYDLVPYLRTEAPPGGGKLAPGAPVAYLVPHEHGVYGGALIADPELQASRYVYKQYFHYVLAANLPELPLWFRQGLAELYSTFRVEGEEALIGLPVEEHVRWLRGKARGQGLQIARETGDGGFEPAPDDAAFYPLAWATVHYLSVGSAADRPQVPDYVRRVVAGEPPEEAFRAAFGRSLRAVQSALGGYVLRERFNYLKVALGALPEPEVRITELSAAEEAYRLGDLLAHAVPGGADRAAKLFRRALALDPDHGGARAGLGWLAARDGDAGGALKAYRTAAGLAPDDFLVQHLYGDALLATLGERRPEGDDELATLRAAQEALSRTTELRPGFPEAWARLGFALNLEPEGSVEAVAVLERAVALVPARMDVALNLMLAYARAGDAVGADTLFAALPARGADSQTLGRAHELRLQLAFSQAILAGRADDLDRAAELMVWIRATTTDPGMAERAAAQLDLYRSAAQHNRFVELFLRLDDQLAAGETEAARGTVAALRDLAQPGRQTEAVEALSERLPAEVAEDDPSSIPPPP